MLVPEDDLELLNNEGHIVEESKFSGIFLGPTYRAIKEVVWATGTVLLCMCIAALVFTYTERKWEILNTDVGEVERDTVYINAEKIKTMKRIFDSINRAVDENVTKIEIFEGLALQMCELKRDVYDYKWHFGGSLDYIISILTTTGWGVIIPDTFVGRFVTVLYFMCGIPVMMLFLYSLTSVIDISFMKMRHCMAERIKNIESHPDGWALYSVSTILMTLLLFMLLLAAGISARREHKWDISGANFVPAWADDGKQNWLYWDAFYFQVISVLTVGFGDFHHRDYDISFGARQFFFVFIPICLFLALSKTLFNHFKKKRSPETPNMAGHQ